MTAIYIRKSLFQDLTIPMGRRGDPPSGAEVGAHLPIWLYRPKHLRFAWDSAVSRLLATFTIAAILFSESSR